MVRNIKVEMELVSLDVIVCGDEVETKLRSQKIKKERAEAAKLMFFQLAPKPRNSLLPRTLATLNLKGN